MSKTESKEQEQETKGRLSEETINYFKRVEQVINENTFEDDEHKETFLKNVYNQIENEGPQLTRHTLTSKVLEKIIPLLTASQIGSFFLLLKPDIELLCCDRFASHVVETLCKTVKAHFGNDETVSEFLSFCKQLRLLCSMLLRNIYGSHILSTVVQVLGGVEVPDVITKSRTNREASKKKKNKPQPKLDETTFELVKCVVPERFEKTFSKLSKTLLEDDNFGELLCHRSASPVLQVLLMVSSKVNKKKYDLLCKLVISRARMFTDQVLNGDEEENEETEHKLPVVFKDDVGSHLIEAIIKTADDRLFDEIASKCFKAFILTLCLHPVANYLAQTFLRCLRSTEQADFFVTKMIKYMEDILASGHMGCVVRLAETIKRLQIVEKQKIFLNTLSTALHIPKEIEKNPFAKLLLCMITYDVFFKIPEDGESSNENEEKTEEPMKLSKDIINYHGACLLNICFMFKKSKLVVDSLCCFDITEHMLVACHPFGCLIFEGFFQSEHIPIKKKAAIAEMYYESLYTLACDKFGSRVVDSMWKTNDPEIQSKLQACLRKDKSRLESDLYGRIILYNCGVKQHVNKMKEIELQQKERKRKAFADILEKKADEPVVKKEKKVKNNDRASKYREQLKMLGISIGDEGEQKAETQNESQSPPVVEDENMNKILHAIEATTQMKSSSKKKKNKKL